MNKEPKEPPPKEPDSLEKLREFTKQILLVPKVGTIDKPNLPGIDKSPKETC